VQVQSHVQELCSEGKKGTERVPSGHVEKFRYSILHLILCLDRVSMEENIAAVLKD
jgi:hypothetical protein